MHLQQTKRESRKHGGPQYYFHDLTDDVREHLREVGAVSVALVTPYGATKSDYAAVSKDRKFDADRDLVEGRVGHDRIQQGDAAESIGEAIRQWYTLPTGDFEWIDIDIEIRDDAFYLKPLSVKYAGKKTIRPIAHIERPLSFTHDYKSKFWLRQIASVARKNPGIVMWSMGEVRRIAKDHAKKTRLPHIQETDILRASGPLNHLGISLGGYVGKGYDCKTDFTFLEYPTYTVPVELKRDSNGFKYQQAKYGKDELSRAVLLCANHGHHTLPAHIDVIELDAFDNFDPMLLSLK